MREQLSSPDPIIFTPPKLEHLASNKWWCWLSPASPVRFEPETEMPARWRYAEWLRAPELNANGVNRGKGIYLWLLDLPSGHYRFVHVGISAEGESTLAERTKHHLRRQRVVKGKEPGDRIHLWRDRPFPPYGSLGEDLRSNASERSKAGVNFLSKLRIMFIYPDPYVPERSTGDIKRLEGLIARSAAYLLDTRDREEGLYWETTNTLGATQNPPETYNDRLPATAREVADCLNKALSDLRQAETGMMPNEPRRPHR